MILSHLIILTIKYYYYGSIINNLLLNKVEQNIMICLWQADQLFGEAEGKSRYFAITEFNNCFIIQSDTEFVFY